MLQLQGRRAPVSPLPQAQDSGRGQAGRPIHDRLHGRGRASRFEAPGFREADAQPRYPRRLHAEQHLRTFDANIRGSTVPDSQTGKLHIAPTTTEIPGEESDLSHTWLSQ